MDTPKKDKTSTKGTNDTLTMTLLAVNKQRRAEHKPQITKVKTWALDVIFAYADAQTEQYLRSTR